MPLAMQLKCDDGKFTKSSLEAFFFELKAGIALLWNRPVPAGESERRGNSGDFAQW